MDKIVLKRELAEGEKIAPQQRALYEYLKAHGLNKEIERKTLVDAVVANGTLVTRQPADRILAYYLPKFIEIGLFEVIKAPVEPKAEKAEKPAEEKAEKSPAEAAPKPAKA